MSRLLLYNPENDLALASGAERYTPPAAGRLMAEAGALLPLWWADEGDELLADNRFEADAARLKEQFGLHGSVGFRNASAAAPWGWSMATRRRFVDAGFNPDRLPTPEQMERIRRLSHRRTSIDLHRMIDTPEPFLPVEASTLSDALAAVNRFGRAVLKQPWSCSGRGVFFTARLRSLTELERLIEGCLRRQGSIIVEPEYDRRNEMAALYYSDGQKVEYRGMSMFECDERGTYLGNVVAPQSQLEKRSGDDAVAAAHLLATPLTRLLAKDYVGWIGVDMLRHEAGLNPCMEINLRMTMGVVAMFLSERLPTGLLQTVKDPAPAGALSLSPAVTPMQIIHRPLPQ